MESAELRMFQMVAKEGSITKAAERLGYVQSNVTARVRQLEAELGTTLFVRHNRGMLLSASGKTLLAYADKIIGMLDEATHALSAGSEPVGQLQIGSTQSAAAVRLPRLLTAYYGRYPRVLLSLTTGTTQSLQDKVLRYELDGAFVGHRHEHPELQTYAAFDEELVVVSAPTVLTLEEAAAKPILVLSAGCSYRDVLVRWLDAGGYSQPLIMEFGTLEAVIGGVSAGLGISLLPRSVADKPEADGLLRTLALPLELSRMETTFIVRKESHASGALAAFIRLLEEAGKVG
ncbi:LysR family transcriptional regulator [Paenibacillus cymbidii]|uniref:LysR family transcriptional regulator n=1 Tax=Paenibacillus cymbidii TaxID=1639034 RepID=UPI00107FDA3A|nr:LysR family transcriptional regulator [Paenibacillus cymbidii]